MRSDEMMDVDVALLEDVVARRCPELTGAIGRIGDAVLSDQMRDRLRRAIVDEMCEQDADDPRTSRRALALEDLLVRLDRV